MGRPLRRKSGGPGVAARATITAMALQQTVDHARIAAALDPLVRADPIRGTLLGTVRLGLTDSAWLACDGPSVAVRSSAQWPVVLTGEWADVGELARALADVAGLAAVSGPPEVIERVVTALGRPVAVRETQRLHRCDRLVPPSVAGSPVFATEEHRELVREWYVAFAREAHETAADPSVADRLLSAGACVVWLDAGGAPVSMAARRPVLAGSARVGPVYTPPEHRGHGYASGATAAATQSIADEGAVPLLFTDVANPTSNHIYRELGYRPVADQLLVRF